MSGHPYVDNACAHNQHARCPGLCPFCDEDGERTPCVCGCHREVVVAAPRPPATPAEPVPAVPRRFPPTAPRTGQLDPVGTYRG